jgi:hypothetical protein
MERKLKLNKEVIAQLNDDNMNRVLGGDAMVTYQQTWSLYPTCHETAFCHHRSYCDCRNENVDKATDNCNLQ